MKKLCVIAMMFLTVLSVKANAILILDKPTYKIGDEIEITLKTNGTGEFKIVSENQEVITLNVTENGTDVVKAKGKVKTSGTVIISGTFTDENGNTQEASVPITVKPLEKVTEKKEVVEKKVEKKVTKPTEKVSEKVATNVDKKLEEKLSKLEEKASTDFAIICLLIASNVATLVLFLILYLTRKKRVDYIDEMGNTTQFPKFFQNGKRRR